MNSTEHNGDTLPVDIGHEMGPMLAKRDRERKELKRLTTTGKTGNDIQHETAKYGYPPDKQEKATGTVLEQAEVLCKEWVTV